MATSSDPPPLTRRTPVDEVRAVIRRPVPAGGHPLHWNCWTNVKLAHQLEAERFLSELGPYPGGFAGRGVVIVGGGKYLPSAFVCARMLRQVGCRLPVQLWHLGDEEWDGRYDDLLRGHGVERVDATAHPAAAATRGLCPFPDAARHRGPVHPPFQLKSFAALHCPFEEVLVLDADVYPAADPTPLFDHPAVVAAGGLY